MEPQLGKGMFLIAAPSLRDPNFRQTVVLLCEHGPEGALGIVVNRPTAVSISEALPHVPIIEGARHVLFAGGPVQQNQIMLLYRGNRFPENAHHVFDHVCLGGDMGMVERILTRADSEESFRAYLGYSGWGPGQLEGEMKTGSWILVPADAKWVFETDPSTVWRDLLLTLGEPYRPYADMPFDPSCN